MQKNCRTFHLRKQHSECRASGNRERKDAATSSWQSPPQGTSTHHLRRGIRDSGPSERGPRAPAKVRVAGPGRTARTAKVQAPRSVTSTARPPGSAVAARRPAALPMRGRQCAARNQDCAVFPTKIENKGFHVNCEVTHKAHDRFASTFHSILQGPFRRCPRAIKKAGLRHGLPVARGRGRGLAGRGHEGALLPGERGASLIRSHEVPARPQLHVVGPCIGPEGPGLDL